MSAPSSSPSATTAERDYSLGETTPIRNAANLS